MTSKAFKHPQNVTLLDSLGSETKCQALLSLICFAISAWCDQICGHAGREAPGAENCLGHLMTRLHRVSRSQSKCYTEQTLLCSECALIHRFLVSAWSTLLSSAPQADGAVWDSFAPVNPSTGEATR